MNDSSTGKYGIPSERRPVSGRHRAAIAGPEVGVLVGAVPTDRVRGRQRVVVLGVMLGHE